MTEKQLEKKIEELQRSIGDTESECSATDTRVRAMDKQRSALALELEAAASECDELRQQEQGTRQDVDRALLEKTAKLLRTSRLQMAARALDDALAGRYKPAVENKGALKAEAASARDKQARIVEVVQQLASSNASIAMQMERVLLHISAVEVA